MWLFLTRRLRQWALLSVALPLGVAILRRVRTGLERRSGSTALTRAVARVERLGTRERGRARRH